MDYLSRHKASGLRVGDRVRITRIAGTEEDGWECGWSSAMDCTVGLIGIIEHDSSISGFKVRIDSGSTWWYPYFVLEKVDADAEITTKDPKYKKPIRYEDPVINDLIQTLRRRYPHGHEGFIPMTIGEMELHSRKNRDYSFSGNPLGNFLRVSRILSLYSGLSLDNPAVIALIYMMKQIDAVFWMLSAKHEAMVEGIPERLGDISIYAKLARILINETTGKKTD